MNPIELIGDAATGGAVGIIGSVINRGINYFEMGRRAKIEIDQKTLDYQHQINMAQLGMDKDAIVASFQGLEKAYDDQIGLSGRTSQWATDILALFRPGLTTLLVVLTGAYAFYQSLDVFPTLATMAGMAIAWWFGDRQMQKLGR